MQLMLTGRFGKGSTRQGEEVRRVARRKSLPFGCGWSRNGHGRLWPKPTLAKTDFDQNRLWPNRLWPNRPWPNQLWPNCGRLYFVVSSVCVVCVCWWVGVVQIFVGVILIFVGVILIFVGVILIFVSVILAKLGDPIFWCCCCCCCLLVLLVGVACCCCLLLLLLLLTALPLDRPSLGPPFPWTALPLDRPSPGPPFPGPPKISLFFFSLSRRKIRSFLPSLGVFSLNFGGVFEVSHDNQKTPKVHN